MSNSVTSELIGDNLSGFAFVLVQQPLKETLCGLAISPLLQEHIYHFTVLIYGSPQVKALTLDLHEDLIDEKCITIPLVFSSQSLGVLRPELVTPQANGFVADHNVSMTEVESVVEPYGILNYFKWETVALIQFGLSHASDSDRLGVNLCGPPPVNNQIAGIDKLMAYINKNPG
jgi:hypothetical protein